MDISTILGDAGDALAAVAPTLATAAGGPLAGMAVTQLEKWIGVGPGTAKQDPAGFQAQLQAALQNPAQVLEMKKLDIGFKQFCLDNDLQWAKLQVEADTAAIAAVNATMAAEAAAAASENWFQKGWRPFCGYVVALGSFVATCGVVWAFGEAMLYGKAEMLAQVPAMGIAISTILAVPGAAVGITAWHRGMLQRDQAAGAKDAS